MTLLMTEATLSVQRCSSSWPVLNYACGESANATTQQQSVELKEEQAPSQHNMTSDHDEGDPDDYDHDEDFLNQFETSPIEDHVMYHRYRYTARVQYFLHQPSKPDEMWVYRKLTNNCNVFVNWVMNGEEQTINCGEGAVYMPRSELIKSGEFFTADAALLGTPLAAVPGIGKFSRFAHSKLVGGEACMTSQISNSDWNEMVAGSSEENDVKIAGDRGALTAEKMSTFFYRDPKIFTALAVNVLLTSEESKSSFGSLAIPENCIPKNAFALTQSTIDTWSDQVIYYFLCRKPYGNGKGPIGTNIGKHTGMILFDMKKFRERKESGEAFSDEHYCHVVSFGLDNRPWSSSDKKRQISIVTSPDGHFRNAFEKQFIRGETLATIGQKLYHPTERSEEWDVFAGGKLTLEQANRIIKAFEDKGPAFAPSSSSSFEDKGPKNFDGPFQCTTMLIPASARDFKRNPDMQKVANEIHPESGEDPDGVLANATYVRLVDNIALSLLRAGFEQSLIETFYEMVSFKYLLQNQPASEDGPETRVRYNLNNGQFDPKKEAHELRVGMLKKNPIVQALRAVYCQEGVQDLQKQRLWNRFWNVLRTSVKLPPDEAQNNVIEPLQEMMFG